ncbi:MAG TPA: penicillin acylase family protein [Actinomycetaceae bacterium]|nr:penicillin acylase family protein [Actinomycetaceae bacterium]
MSFGQRLTAAIAAVIVVVLVAAGALSAVLLRRPLPDHGGTVTLNVLDGRVEILRDERGVPHIYADTDADIFRAQGYVHAQDRFFEMDYRRHLTAGRLAELVGEDEDAIAADRVIRTFGWRRVAEQEWDLLSPESQAFYTAYAEGVNAYLTDREASQLGVEYTVLGLVTDLREIEEWSPIDSLVWLKAMAWDLAANYEAELGRAAALRPLQSDPERVAELYPPYPAELNAPIVPGEVTEAAAVSQVADGEGAAAQAADAIDSALAAVQAAPVFIGEGDGVGSNSFVISGEHTASGAPLLANDPHLAISAPGIWYQVGLHCRELSSRCTFDVTGFSFAGMPGVIIGHNPELAWGLTNLGADVIDFFLARVYDDGTYLREGERIPLKRRSETIIVNGGADVALTVAATEHGPIVSGVLPAVSAANNTPLADDGPSSGAGGYAVAMSWTALQPGRTGDAVFALNRATDAESVAAAAELFEVPAQNIVFATAEGDIGYQAPGKIPIRGEVSDTEVPADGSWPRPGWDARYDWQGFVPADDMPRDLNPERGYIVTANQAVQPPGESPFLSNDFDYGYRAERIRQQITTAIERGDVIDEAWANEVMIDNHNPLAAELVPALLRVDVEDAFVAEAVELFEGWRDEGYPQDGDSAAAAYFAAVWAQLLDLTFNDELPASIAPDGGSRWLAVVSGLLEDPHSTWWDDRTTVNLVESRDEILLRSLVQARKELTNRLGKDPTSWQWANLHVAAPTHAVLGAQVEPIQWVVNPTPIGVGGGSSIVNATAWNAQVDEDGVTDYSVTAVPSMRMAIDMGNRDGAQWVSLTGNSGHPASRHYDDQFEAWAAGETFPWPSSRSAVVDAAVDILTLEP